MTASFEAGQVPPVGLFEAWIDESYRAQAPKRLVKALDERAGQSASPAGKPSKKTRGRPGRRRST